jgi:site-specific DNA-methyltransferase (adenine-specific)
VGYQVLAEALFPLDKQLPSLGFHEEQSGMRVETIGSATLYLGDCREILPTLPRMDALITDPPYGIKITKSHRLAVSRGMGGLDWDDAPPSMTELAMMCAAGRDKIIWGGNYFPLPPTRCLLVWDKQNDGRDFADLEVAWTNLDAVARIFRMRPMNMDGGKEHPAQKPLQRMRWCISKCNDPKSVIDPYMGSGSTGCAAVGMGMSFVGIEAHEPYFDLACERISNSLRQERLFA